MRTYFPQIQNISLTTDILTETMTTKSFLGITIHFINGIELQSLALGVMDALDQWQNSVYIVEQLTSFLNNWNISIDKINTVVMDTAANMTKAIYDLFGYNKHIPCFEHTVNLMVEDGLKKIEGLDDFLPKITEIVKFIKRSVNSSDQLRRAQKERDIKEGDILKLILDAKIR